MSVIVSLEGLAFYAFHGVHPSEHLVGCHYLVDIALTMNRPENGFEDNLKNTINYEEVYVQIASVMQSPVNLIETLAEDIMDRIFATQFRAMNIAVAISKMHPSIGGECLKSKIFIERARR